MRPWERPTILKVLLQQSGLNLGIDPRPQHEPRRGNVARLASLRPYRSRADASLLVPIAARGSRAADSYEITDWIVIVPSGEVTLALSQPEVGQGSYTALRKFSPTSSTPIGSGSRSGL
jgi:hypothetical protein